MTITLESLRADLEAMTAKLAQFDAQFEKQTQQFAPCTVTFPALNDGEQWLGAIISADGSKRHHVILLPGELESSNWKHSMEWAANIGGDLPDRSESALLFATMKSEFKEGAYWMNTQHAAHSDSARYQGFYYGIQDNLNKSSQLRARAVRRVVIA